MSQRLGAREIARLQLHRRRVADPKSERFSQWFSSKCPIPLSVWIPATQSHALKHGHSQGLEARRGAAPSEHFLGIFTPSSSSHVPTLGLSSQGTPSCTLPGAVCRKQRDAALWQSNQTLETVLTDGMITPIALPPSPHSPRMSVP